MIVIKQRYDKAIEEIITINEALFMDRGIKR